jgi:hypothetical protein
MDDDLAKIAGLCSTRADFEQLARLRKLCDGLADLQQRLAHLEREDALRKRLEAAWVPPGARPNGLMHEGMPT